METLVNKAKEGDVAAFRALYQELSNPVFLFVRARTQNRDDALDMLQEVFIDFWKSLNRFNFLSEKELMAFLYTIASRKLYKFYRFRRVTVSIEEISDFTADSSNESESSRQEFVDILNSMQFLSRKDKELIELRNISGLPFAQVASLLKTTENAAKVRHHRAVQKLKSLLNYE